MDVSKHPGDTGTDADVLVQRPHPDSLTYTAQKHEVVVSSPVQERKKVTICKFPELSHKTKITERIWVSCLKFKVKEFFPPYNYFPPLK